MNSSSALTSGWKDATSFDQLARQITSFLFPNRRLIARFKSDSALPSVTLWQEGSECFLAYLTDQSMREEHLTEILNVFSKIYDEGIVASDQPALRMAMSLFAAGFHPNFLSKLRFFAWPTQTYAWARSESDQKETVLVREVGHPIKQTPFKSESLRPGNGASENVRPEGLSSEELSAFVQLGMDLRKIRQAPLVH